ncbi:hypothetical protein SEPCBS119000_004450 [Sporothrix epigloea]|uniref:Lipid droplet-associated hydrolase n=1 Tax=Sporothrix epigloea TaxID=1892477 RepID=A0ABP0DS69_9PEZI
MPVRLSYPSRPVAGSGAQRVPSPPPQLPAARTKHILVYFVPGNPGLIDYYAPFLATLRMLLDETEDRIRETRSGRATRFHLLGRNLLGFEDSDDGGSTYGPGPYDLATQIRGVRDAVAAARIDVGKDDVDHPRCGEAFDEVVLIGHSVGAYIALEVFRLQMLSQRTAKTVNDEQDSRLSSVKPTACSDHLRLRRGILLFATLAHLARSQRGQKLERMLLTIPVVSGWADILAQAAVWWLLPVWALALIVRYILRFPPHAADTTLRFLSSRGGIRQALFLGRDELLRIGPDEWEDELWEAVDDGGDADDGKQTDERKDVEDPKFVIFFGRDDHWVANDVRDEFIARRKAHAKNRAAIFLDERGWPHDFCIRHGEEVAETVKLWIADLAETA